MVDPVPRQDRRGRQRAGCPAGHKLRKPTFTPANILVIGATNRADDLDPALVRPGRFDRNIYFGLPGRAGRRDIFDYYLGKKAHEPELDDPARRETLAAMTAGYSPVMIEHLLDEALVWALRRGANRLSWHDVQQAKMTEEIGLAQPVEYTEAERRSIATHEAGHATVAWLVGKGRKLEVLTIVKRKDALGLLSHSETEERFTKSKSEVRAMIDIAFGGMVAEELFFGESSTGVSSDLQAATVNACQMIGLLGMGSSLISVGAIEHAGGGLVGKVLSDEASRAEVEELLRRVQGVGHPDAGRAPPRWSRPCGTPSWSGPSSSARRSWRSSGGHRPTRTSCRATSVTSPACRRARPWPGSSAPTGRLTRLVATRPGAPRRVARPRRVG